MSGRPFLVSSVICGDACSMSDVEAPVVERLLLLLPRPRRGYFDSHFEPDSVNLSGISFAFDIPMREPTSVPLGGDPPTMEIPAELSFKPSCDPFIPKA